LEIKKNRGQDLGCLFCYFNSPPLEEGGVPEGRGGYSPLWKRAGTSPAPTTAFVILLIVPLLWRG